MAPCDKQHGKKVGIYLFDNVATVRICLGPVWMRYDLPIYISHINKVILDGEKHCE